MMEFYGDAETDFVYTVINSDFQLDIIYRFRDWAVFYYCLVKAPRGETDCAERKHSMGTCVHHINYPR